MHNKVPILQLQGDGKGKFRGFNAPDPWSPTTNGHPGPWMSASIKDGLSPGGGAVSGRLEVANLLRGVDEGAGGCHASNVK